MLNIYKRVKNQSLLEYIDEEKNDSKLNSRTKHLSLHDKECVTVKFHMAKKVVVLQTIM